MHGQPAPLILSGPTRTVGNTKKGRDPEGLGRFIPDSSRLALKLGADPRGSRGPLSRQSAKLFPDVRTRP